MASGAAAQREVVRRTMTGDLMRNKTLDFDVIREIARALPDVEESTIIRTTPPSFSD